MKNKNIGYLALGLMAAAAPAANAAGTIVGGDFEGVTLVDDGSGVGKFGPFTGNAASTYSVSTTNPHTGAEAMDLDIGGVANSFVGVFQDVTIAPLETINYSLFHAANVAAAGAIEIRIEWRDSVNNVEISRTGNSTPSPGTSYELFSLVETAPAGADTARVVYALQSFGGNTTIAANVDDITVIPEPTSSLLAGLSALGLMIRRRR